MLLTSWAHIQTGGYGLVKDSIPRLETAVKKGGFFVQLSESDQKELDKQLLNPEFEKLYFDLIFLKKLRYPDLVVQRAPNGSGKDGLVTPQDLENLENLKLRTGVTSTEKIPLKLAQLMATELWREVILRANRLASFFPSKQHRRWMIIFELIAMNRHGHFAKIEQNRGRPDGSGKYRNKKEFESALQAAVAGLKDNGEYPSQQRVADLLYFEDKKEIQRYCKKFGITWKDIIRE